MRVLFFILAKLLNVKVIAIFTVVAIFTLLLLLNTINIMKHLKTGLIVLAGVITFMLGLKFLTYDYQTITTLPIIATTLIGIQLIAVGTLTIIYSDVLKPLDKDIKARIFPETKVDDNNINERTELHILNVDLTDAKVKLLNLNRLIDSRKDELASINEAIRGKKQSSAYKNPFPIKPEGIKMSTRLKGLANEEAFKVDDEVMNKVTGRNKYGFPDLDGGKEGEDDLNHFGVDKKSKFSELDEEEQTKVMREASDKIAEANKHRFPDV